MVGPVTNTRTLIVVFLLQISQKTAFGESSADLTDEDWKTLGFNLVVLKDQVDDGFTTKGQPLQLQGSYHTAILQKYTNGNKCFQLLTIDCDMIEKGKMKDSVKVSCEMTVPKNDMSATGIKIGNIIMELSPGRFMFVVQGGDCHRRLYLTLFPRVINRKVNDVACKRYTKSEKEDRARGVITTLSEDLSSGKVKDDKETKDNHPVVNMSSGKIKDDKETKDNHPDVNKSSVKIKDDKEIKDKHPDGDDDLSEDNNRFRS